MSPSREWIVIDANNLAHRAFHTTGSLGQERNGTIFGFLNSVASLQRTLNSPHLVFCFDSRTSLREKAVPSYKEARRKKWAEYDEEEKQARLDLVLQINELRTKVLIDLGYENVFCQKGYEADDLIAFVVNGLWDGESAVIVSSDRDLFQLLSHRVRVWRPSSGYYTKTDLHNEFGVAPEQWAHVKALAGCDTDGVKGIEGVGEITAAKFLRGQIKEGSVIHGKIMTGLDSCKPNLRLVRLPFPGVGGEGWDLRENRVTMRKVKAVAKELDMPSLVERFAGTLGKGAVVK